MPVIKRVKVELHQYYVEFYKPCGTGFRSAPFYTVGNYEIGREFAFTLELLGIKVKYVDCTEEDEAKEEEERPKKSHRPKVLRPSDWMFEKDT